MFKTACIWTLTTAAATCLFLLTSLQVSSSFYDYIYYIYLFIYMYVYVCVYTRCPRRNVPDFGRVFLVLKYTDITQNTYVQS
jgi:hypothetical protein